MMISFVGYGELACIYESPNSQIFRARREQDGLMVVVKLLREDYHSAHELIRYRQEVKIAGLLNGRPGIIQTLGSGEHGSTLFLVLEDFGGDSLLGWTNRRAFSLTEKLSLAIKLASSIGEVHAAQVIHKDINLANVVYNPDSEILKLIDFGLSTSLRHECPAITSPNALEGTLAYLSPEQTGRMNRLVDYRTDFYSLGASLYQLFTGRVPFESSDPMELVHCHLARQPDLPHELNPEIPRMVSKILMKLMAKTPEERYQSAAGIQVDLRQCLRQILRTAQIRVFDLGQHDFSERLVIPQKLYGREKELERLLAAFERVAVGTHELTLLAGHSGIGKTALVQELFRPMTARRGYFISGKFDARQGDRPYGALSEAFKQLIGQLLTEPEAQLCRWRQELGQALGPNAKVIVRLIPDLERVLGLQPELEEVGPLESQNRFNFVFQSFIQVLARPTHPLILFVDDLQWADASSLKMLKLFLTTPDLQGLHLICAYRANEVDPTHPWMQTVKELDEAGCRIESISLGPLDVALVQQFLSDTLRSRPDGTQVLAELLHGKTQGNPFFLAAFLHALERDNLLRLDHDSGVWQWDIQQIRSLNIADNVAGLMVGSIRRLDPRTQQVMSLAACMGHCFELNTLSVVCESPPRETLTRLQPALDQGFVLPLGQAYQAIEHDLPKASKAQDVVFKFAHDRVQQAAYGLIDEEQKKAIHWKIGQLLRASGADPIDIVDHLNFSLADQTDPAAKKELAQLNFQAARKAKAASAHTQAAHLLACAQRLLGEHGWAEDYQLTREITEAAAETAYFLGDYPGSERLASEVERHTSSVLEKATACKLRILCQVARNQPLAAVDTGLAYLASLGYRLPREPSLLRVGWELLRIKLRFARMDIQALAERAEMTEAVPRTANRIITLIAAAAVFCRPKLYALLICQAVRIELQHGQSPVSCLSGMANVFSSALGDPKTGYELGELSLRMAATTANCWLSCRAAVTFNAFVKHWRIHLSDTIQGLHEAIQRGIDAGDFEYAAYAAFMYCQHRFLLGEELSNLDSEMTSFSAQIARLGQNMPLASIQMFHQDHRRLLDQAEEPYRLLGKVLDEPTMLSNMEGSSQWTGVAAFHFCKLLPAVVLQRSQEAFASAERCEEHIESIMGTFGFGRFYFLAALAFLGVCAQKNKKERRRLLRKVSQNLRKLRRWARNAPMNHLHAWCLVKAEQCRVLNRPKKATGFYRRSIELAHEHKWVHEEGLANELAGRFYLEQKNEPQAVSHLLAARFCYMKWGAKAKVDQMDGMYGELLSECKEKARARKAKALTNPMLSMVSGKIDSTSLDLGSAIKASQAISGEIELDKLLTTLMKIIQENAGAEKVCLILKRGEGFVVEALLEGLEQQAYQKVSIGLDQCEQLSPEIVRYSIRSQENLVLGDAAVSGNFTLDPYVLRRKPRSILCCPVLRHKTLVGVLYLENNQAAEAFTPDRVELFRLLAAQAAISLENAKLFGELQQALEQAQESVRAKNEFLAKTTHELRTPLNAIINLPEGLKQSFYEYRVIRCERCRSLFQPEDEPPSWTELDHCPTCQAQGSLRADTECRYDGELREIPEIQQCIVDSGRSLLHIVNNILELSEHEGKKSQLRLDELQVDRLLENVISQARTQAEKKEIRLSVPQGDTEVTWRADWSKLEQVFINLLDNAIKFSPAQSEVILSCDRLQDQLCFSIRDQGIGIAPQDQTRIFESFRQLDEGATRKYGGVGLGLAVTKNLVELHGGSIWVESELGQGSTFHVKLPLINDKDHENKEEH